MTRLLLAGTILLVLPPRAEAQVMPKPKNPTIPITPGGKSGNSGVDALTAAKKRAPVFEDVRLLVATCAEVPVGSIQVLNGRVRRQPGGDPIGTLNMLAVLASGDTVPLGGNARWTGSAHDGLVFDASDDLVRYGRGQVPVAYTLVMTAEPGAYAPNRRLDVKWRWAPSVSLIGAASDLSLSRQSDGRVRVRLPELRLYQTTGPVTVRITRTGMPGSAQGAATSAYRPTRPDGQYATRQFSQGDIRVPADWGDPASWSGEVEILAYGPATECDSGRQPRASLRIPLRSSSPVAGPSTLAGHWYRLACTSTPAYGPILDDTIRACNANTLVAGFQTRCSQRATALNGPFSNAYTSRYVGYSVDPDYTACNPIPENWSLISSVPRGR